MAVTVLRVIGVLLAIIGALAALAFWWFADFVGPGLSPSPSNFSEFVENDQTRLQGFAVVSLLGCWALAFGAFVRASRVRRNRPADGALGATAGEDGSLSG